MNRKIRNTHDQKPAGNTYEKIIAGIFAEKYIPGSTRVEFQRRDIEIEQDIAMCKAKFPSLICVPVAACAMNDRVIALFTFEPPAQRNHSNVCVTSERHYRLVPPEEISADLLAAYAQNQPDGG